MSGNSDDVYVRATEALQNYTAILPSRLRTILVHAGLAIVDATNPAAPVTDEGFEELVDELEYRAGQLALGNCEAPGIVGPAYKTARTRVLTAHAEAIKAAEAKVWERAEVTAEKERVGFIEHNCTPQAFGAACVKDAIRAASKTGEAS